MMKKFIFIMLVVCSYGASAKEKILVTAFSFDQVEVRSHDKYTFVDANKLGHLPITVLRQDKKGWVKLSTNYSDDVWVDKAAVTLNNQKQVIVCQNMQIAENPNRKMHGSRGLGEKCQ